MAAILVIALTALNERPAWGHDPEEDQTGVVTRSAIENVGDVTFATSCAGEQTASAFNHALGLLHHMVYVVAEQEFRQIAERAPGCAMAHWGVAMTLVHPVWPGKPSANELLRGAAALARARELEKTEREARYIEALGAFYDEAESVDHWERIRRWDRAQGAVFEAHPDDDDALAFYAIVHVAASPKNDLEYRMNREAGAHLEGLFQRRPQHPGAIHYLIHAYDNPPLAQKALEAARSYGAIAPEVEHALHMPSHIFTRLGFWMESVEWNIRSREAARKVLVDGAIYGGFGHASDYMTYAYLQAGQDAKALEARDALFEAEPLHDGFANAYALSAVPARIALELGSWNDAASLAPRAPASMSWDRYPAYEATTHFARGIGAARLGNVGEARKSAEAIERIVEQLQQAGLPYWVEQGLVQRSAVRAWVAFTEGRTEQALDEMRRAAEREDRLDKHPVTPGAVIPARELYGDMLSLQERWGEALAAYEATLAISPGRFNSLAGAGLAAARAGDSEKAQDHYGRLVEIAGDGDTIRPGLERARAYLSAD